VCKSGKKPFLTLLFSQYLYADLSRCHISMVIGSATTKSPRQHHLRLDSIETSRHSQLASVASAQAWLGRDITPWPSYLNSVITSMTRHQHRVTAKLPRQHHRQHELALTLHYSQHHLGSTITSMTRGLGAYFPDQQPDSEVHHRSDSGLEEYQSNQ
jgi:precorrin-4 methylase